MINKPTTWNNKNWNNIWSISKTVQDRLYKSIDVMEVWKLIIDQVIDKIKNKDIEHLGQGTEWVVYKVKVKLPWNNEQILLVVKKRFDNNLKNEIDMQNKFYDIAQDSKCWIKVPKALWETNIDWDNYLLMEFVNGKTLFNLKLEKIASEIYKKFADKYPEFFNELTAINKDIDINNINKKSMINFNTDEDARKQMYRILSFLNDQWEIFIRKHTWVQGAIILDTKSFNDLLTKIYYDNDIDKSVFSLKEWRDIQERMKKFFYEAHKKWCFHRDIWWNPTNIMFEQDWDKIIPVVIDFGKSKTYEWDWRNEYERWNWPYAETGRTGDMDWALPDTRICTIIQWITEPYKDKERREK